jgi:hypothetical protein
MQSQEMDMKDVLNTVAQVLLRATYRRAALIMHAQSQARAGNAEDYRSNAGGWN